MLNNTDLIPIYICIENGYPFGITEEEYKKYETKGTFLLKNNGEKLYVVNLDEDKIKPLVKFLINGYAKKSWLKIILLILGVIVIGGIILVLVYSLIFDSKEAKQTTNLPLIQPNIVDIKENPVELVQKVESSTGTTVNTSEMLEKAVEEVKKENTEVQSKLAFENKLYYCEAENERLKYDIAESNRLFEMRNTAFETCKTQLDISNQKIFDLEPTPIDKLYNSIGRDIYGHCEDENLSDEKKQNCTDLYINYLKKYGIQ